MRKMLLTVAAAGALAVPFGVILAEDDPTEPADPTPASTDPDRVRDRDRQSVETPATVEEPLGQPAEDCECDGEGPKECERAQNRFEEGSGEGPQQQNRHQNRFDEESGMGPQAQNRDQNRFEEGSGEGPQTQNRHQNRFEEGTGPGPQSSEPEQTRVEEGTSPGPQSSEPEQTRVEDGSGNAGNGATTGGPVATTTDDGANLQFQYGEGNGQGNR